MYWEETAYVLANKIRVRIIEMLGESNKPLTPRQLDKLSNISLGNISTQLIELKKRKLVECLNPKAKKFRLYVLTDRGKEVLKEVKQMIEV